MIHGKWKLVTYPVSVIVVGVSGTVNPLLGKKGLALKICICCVCLCLCLCVRERPNGVINWVTFNYACVDVCICDAQHSSATVHWERFQESRKFWTECYVTVVFIYTKNCVSDRERQTDRQTDRQRGNRRRNRLKEDNDWKWKGRNYLEKEMNTND